MADTPDYEHGQPEPIKVDGAVSAHDLVCEDIRRLYLPAVVEVPIATLQRRKAYGMGKYGTVLHKDNGRQHSRDAEEEVMDLIVYLRTWMEESPEQAPDIWPHYISALDTFMALQRWHQAGFLPRSTRGTRVLPGDVAN